MFRSVHSTGLKPLSVPLPPGRGPLGVATCTSAPGLSAELSTRLGIPGAWRGDPTWIHVGGRGPREVTAIGVPRKEAGCGREGALIPRGRPPGGARAAPPSPLQQALSALRPGVPRPGCQDFARRVSVPPTPRPRISPGQFPSTALFPPSPGRAWRRGLRRGAGGRGGRGRSPTLC